MAMIDPQDITAAQQALGVQLARLREAAGDTQAAFATRIPTSRSTVANVETGHSRGTLDFWTRSDKALQARGALVRGYEEVRALVSRQREEAARAAAAARSAAVGQVAYSAVGVASGAGALRERHTQAIGSLLTGPPPMGPFGGGG